MLAVLLINRMITRRRKACKVVKEGTTDMKTLETEYCRTCLGTDDLVSLFNGKGSDRKRSKDLLVITGLDIKINDGLSQKICSKCIKSLEVALKFRRTSRKAYKALLTNTSCKSEPVEKTYSTIDAELPIVKSPEPKIEEYDRDGYGCNVFGDDFQNDQDYKEEDVKPKKIKQKPSTPVKKARVDIPNASSYKCTWCSKEFRMKATFKAHMRFHTNYCVCESCGKRCRNNNQLQEHKRARHGLGKIHKCAYCEYSSATKEALTIHERRHTGERPYICDHCGATFHRRSNLVQHIAIHLPEKNFQCDLCPKRLQSRKLLQIHKHNAHTGKRYGYLCAVCAHRFEKPNKVRAHTRRVHGVPDHRQPPVCRFCSKWEKSHKLLQVHIHKRHKANRYRYLCPICGEIFTRPGNVRQHLFRGHGVPKAQQGVIQKFEVNPVVSKYNMLDTNKPCLRTL